jgi:caffeoyl-CoA O-methyltransferase
VIVSAAVAEYLESLRKPPDDVLGEMEELAARERIPIVVPETGALLNLLARGSGARRVVEVGTAIGVSTLYLARALPEDGELVSFEIDEERLAAARGFLERAGVLDRCELRLEDAKRGLADLAGPFDLAFIDALKREYADYLEPVVGLVRSGGLILVDNVLMSGTVAEGRGNEHWSDEHVREARAFNERFLRHPDLDAMLTPIGDGVGLAVRR